MFWPGIYAYSSASHLVSVSGLVTLTSVLLRNDFTPSITGSTRALLWHGGYGVSEELPPSPVFCGFFVVLTSTFICMAPWLAGGSHSPVPSPLHTTPEWLFEVFPASADLDPWLEDPLSGTYSNHCIVSRMSSVVFLAAFSDFIWKEKAHTSTAICHPPGNLGSGSCYHHVEKRFTPLQTSLDYSPFNSPPVI